MKHIAILPFIVTQNWKGQAEDLRLRYEVISDTDLEFEPAKDDDVLTRIGKRLTLNRTVVIAVTNQGLTPEDK